MSRVWIAVLVLCWVAPMGAAPQVQPPEAYVEIDGSKNPEQIPDWATWEMAFSALALAQRSESKAVPESLHMSDADQRLVFAAAKGQAGRDTACQQKVERLRPMLGKAEASAINERTREIQLECRQATLDAAESLMSSLSPEGQTSMTAWLQTERAAIRARVPKGELDHYRRPH